MNILKSIAKLIGCLLSTFINLIGSIMVIIIIFTSINGGNAIADKPTFIVLVSLGGILTLLNDHFISRIHKSEIMKEMRNNTNDDVK